MFMYRDFEKEAKGMIHYLDKINNFEELNHFIILNNPNKEETEIIAALQNIDDLPGIIRDYVYNEVDEGDIKCYTKCIGKKIEISVKLINEDEVKLYFIIESHHRLNTKYIDKLLENINENTSKYIQEVGLKID